MLYKDYLDENTVFQGPEDDPFFQNLSTQTPTPGGGTPAPTGTPSPYDGITPGVTSSGNTIEVDSSGRVGETLSVTELETLVRIGVLDWSDAETILLDQAEGRRLPPAVVANYKVRAAQAVPATRPLTQPELSQFDTTPTESALENITRNLNPKTGRFDVILQDGTVVNLTKGITVGGEGAGPYGNFTGDRFTRVEAPGKFIVYDGATGKYMDFTAKAAELGVPGAVAGGAAVGSGGGTGGGAELPPQSKDDAILQFEGANPGWTVYNTTNPNEFLAQDAQGRQGVYRYSPSTGALTLVEQGMNVNARTGENIARLPVEDAIQAMASGQLWEKFIEDNGYPPSAIEIQKMLGGSSFAFGHPDAWMPDQRSNLSPAEQYKGLFNSFLRMGLDEADADYRAQLQVGLTQRANEQYRDPTALEKFAPGLFSGRPQFSAQIGGEEDSQQYGGVAFDPTSPWRSGDLAAAIQGGNMQDQAYFDAQSQAVQQDYATAVRDAQQAEASANVDPREQAQIMANYLNMAKGRGYSIEPSANGWVIIGPDGKPSGSYKTSDDAEQWLSILMARLGQREAEARRNRMEFRPVPRQEPEPRPVREETQYTPKPKPQPGPVLPDLPPPVDTAPPPSNTPPIQYPVFAFNEGGSVNMPGRMGQPNLMLDEPAVLTGMKTGRPYAVAGEAGTKEMVSPMSNGGLEFTPTSMPMQPQGMPPTPPPDPLQEAKAANDWQEVARITGQPLSQVLREAAKERSKPKLRV